uniref:Uncharacterized protein MANES_15G184500 n=1 Tax=Rhizophora mucronata TaxID=61149 RepID=A0A2P2JT71_RHIMU
MICLVLAQAIGSLLIRIIFRLRDGRHGCRAKRPWIAIAVGALSWWVINQNLFQYFGYINCCCCTAFN